MCCGTTWNKVSTLNCPSFKSITKIFCGELPACLLADLFQRILCVWDLGKTKLQSALLEETQYLVCGELPACLLTDLFPLSDWHCLQSLPHSDRPQSSLRVAQPPPLRTLPSCIHLPTTYLGRSDFKFVKLVQQIVLCFSSKNVNTALLQAGDLCAS